MNNIFDNKVFEGLDRDFLEKVQTTISSMNGKSDVEIIGTFMALSNEASDRGIKMNSEQQKALILFLRDALPPEKRQKFDLFISMMD